MTIHIFHGGGGGGRYTVSLKKCFMPVQVEAPFPKADDPHTEIDKDIYLCVKLYLNVLEK